MPPFEERNYFLLDTRKEIAMRIRSFISLLLTLAIIIGMINVPIYAEDADYGGKIKIDTSMVTGGTGYKGSSFKNAVDGDYATFYDGLLGQYVQIQLDKEYELSAIGYAARRNRTLQFLGRDGAYT